MVWYSIGKKKIITLQSYKSYYVHVCTFNQVSNYLPINRPLVVVVAAAGNGVRYMYSTLIKNLRIGNITVSSRL